MGTWRSRSRGGGGGVLKEESGGGGEEWEGEGEQEAENM